MCFTAGQDSQFKDTVSASTRSIWNSPKSTREEQAVHDMISGAFTDTNEENKPNDVSSGPQLVQKTATASLILVAASL